MFKLVGSVVLGCCALIFSASDALACGGSCSMTTPSASAPATSVPSNPAPAAMDHSKMKMSERTHSVRTYSYEPGTVGPSFNAHSRPTTSHSKYGNTPIYMIPKALR